MSFDYNKNKHAHSGDSFWTSYSDLFLGLSTIFLLLYVTASLRTGTDAIKNQVENQKLTMEVEELRSQMKMYEQVKANYLEKEASKDEVQEYQELMDKLTLLKEEAKTDQEKLAKQALENERKAGALNKYQQLVRNMINANKMAKTKIIARNDIIDSQDSTIDQQKTDIGQLQQDITRVENTIAATEKSLEKSKKQLMMAYKQNKLTRKQFEEKTRHLQKQSDEKLKSLQEQNANYASQLNQLTGELEGTQSQLQGVQSQLKGTQAALTAKAQESDELKGEVAGLSGKLKSTEGALAKAKEEIDARRGVAREIQKGFQAAGIKADVDMQTGEVVLDFGDAYFDNDSSNLKPKMKEVIERAMPVYSKSLFGNEKIANKISSVEVIGFASPTYKGRFVDPKSNKPEDKAALKYNMDLSYRRANAIFTYLLDDKDSEFQKKEELLARMKVSGRSFLEVMKVQSRGLSTAAEFCKVNDCKKTQKVIVRFSMDGKK